jgi:hypothetical protein
MLPSRSALALYFPTVRRYLSAFSIHAHGLEQLPRCVRPLAIRSATPESLGSWQPYVCPRALSAPHSRPKMLVSRRTQGAARCLRRCIFLRHLPHTHPSN